MGLLRTKVAVKGGGPCDGEERILPNGKNLILVARIHLLRDALGVLRLVQDPVYAHGYVRLDPKTFAYDGLRTIEAGPSPVPVEERSLI